MIYLKLWILSNMAYLAWRLLPMNIKVDVNPLGEYTAIDADTYDCDCDQDGFFSTSPVGYGRTEAEAIEDLKDKLED
jgi:hypothetical protein